MKTCLLLSVVMVMGLTGVAQAQMFDSKGEAIPGKGIAALQCVELPLFERAFGDWTNSMLGQYGLGYVSGYVDFDLEVSQDEHGTAVAAAYNSTPLTVGIIAAYVRAYCVTYPTQKVEAAYTQIAHGIHAKTE